MSVCTGNIFEILPPLDWHDASKRTVLNLPRIIGADEAFAERLTKIRALFVGAGAVGGPVMMHFAQIKVGAIYVADPKPFREESLHSQLTDRTAIGRFKAEYRAGVCKTISPETEVGFYNGNIQDIHISALKGVNLIILGSDNLTAEIYASQLGLWLRCPVIQGAVHAETTVSLVKTFSNRDGKGPCGACLLNELEWSQAHGEIEYTCDPGDSKESGPQIRTVPTNCLPNTSSHCASMVTTQAQKLIGGFGIPVADTMHEFCGHTGKAALYPLKQNPSCPLDHDTYFVFRESPGPMEARSILELAEDSAISPTTSFLVTVASHDWTDAAHCAKEHLSSRKGFLPSGSPIGGSSNCSVCHVPVTYSPFLRRDSVSSESLGTSIAKPLSDLGVTSATWIKIQQGDRTVMFTPNTKNP